MDIAPDKRERILSAAAKLIVQNGLQCSMAAIAEEAGVATGSLYNYFTSKEDLVRGVYSRISLDMTERLTAPMAPGTPHAQRIQHYIALYIDFIWEDALRARLFDYLDNTPLISAPEASSIFMPFVEHAKQMLEAARADGVVIDMPATILASFVRGAIRNTLKRRRAQPAPLTDAESSTIAAMCWNAIVARA